MLKILLNSNQSGLVYEMVHWLYAKVCFDPQLLPPSHMPVAYGPVKSRKAKVDSSQKDTAVDGDDGRVCTICSCRLSVCLFVLK